MLDPCTLAEYFTSLPRLRLVFQSLGSAMKLRVSTSLLCLLLFETPIIGGTLQSSDKTLPERVPWIEKLPTIRADTRTASFRARMRHIVPRQDGWISERYYEEIDVRLKEFSAVLVTQPLDGGKLTSFFHGEFRGTSLTPLRRVTLRKEAPVIQRLDPAREHRVTVGEFLTELERYLAGDHTLVQVKFKMIAISLDPDGTQIVHARVSYDIVGRAASGAVMQYVGHLQLD